MAKKTPEDVSIGKFDILATYTYAHALLNGLDDDEAKQRGMVAAIMGAQARLGIRKEHHEEFQAQKEAAEKKKKTTIIVAASAHQRADPATTSIASESLQPQLRRSATTLWRAGMLLQQRQREPVQPRKVLATCCSRSWTILAERLFVQTPVTTISDLPTTPNRVGEQFDIHRQTVDVQRHPTVSFPSRTTHDAHSLIDFRAFPQHESGQRLEGTGSWR